MARIREEELTALKSKVDLVALVQSKGVELKRHGSKDLIGTCPFHADRTPSLVVSPDKNLWHCLGACGAGGSVIDWVMRCEGVSFRHAVELLRGEDLGKILSPTVGPRVATVPKLPAPVALGADEKTLLAQVIDYYHETLKTAPEAREYLKSRGLDHEEAIVKFKLGFANRTLGLRLPDSNRAEGAQVREKLQRIGLYRETGREHFNGSLVIPVITPSGEITEVYGRKIIPRLRVGTPYHTYLPGPHRGVWNEEGLKSGDVILCEALLDALTFWVHGFRNVTASYGVSGFTEDHLAAFIRCGVKKVFIAYDRDEAGDRAAAELAVKLEAEGIRSLRVLFPKGMDANAFATKVLPPRQALSVCLESAEWMGKGKAPSPAIVPELKAETPSAEIPTPVPAQATSSPLAAGPEIPTEIRGEEIVIRLGEREYRVRGLSKNMSYEVMKVNLRAGIELRYHVDLIDLYQAKARSAFIHAAGTELGVKEEIIKRDLGRVLLKLESLQDEQIKAFLSREAKETVVTVPEEEKAEAMTLLRDPNILGRIRIDFARCGMIGEEMNLLVGYLAGVSRKLDDPLAIVIQSSSAAGKSSLMEAVLAMVPDEEKVKYSAMTGQSLFYMGEKNLKHKILAIAEEEGAKQASYALKLLQSEGEIKIASTGKDQVSGRHITHEYRVEGPVMIFLTTTAIEIDEELLNRCLVLTVNEGREQTKAIHEMQRKSQTLAGQIAKRDKAQILKLHQNAQRLIRPLLVANPFAEKLSFLDHQTRTRRDHMKYLTLIRSIALLHQYSREVKRTKNAAGEEVEYIEVTIADIETANALCHQVLGRSLDELPPQTRRLLTLVAEAVKQACLDGGLDRENYHFTRKQVREWSGWSDFQVQTHVQKLSELEYLLPHRGKRGQLFVYELLWEEGLSGGVTLPGLTDVAALYDPGFKPLMRSFEPKNENFEGGSSGDVVPSRVVKSSNEIAEQAVRDSSLQAKNTETRARPLSKSYA